MPLSHRVTFGNTFLKIFAIVGNAWALPLHPGLLQGTESALFGGIHMWAVYWALTHKKGNRGTARRNEKSTPRGALKAVLCSLLFTGCVFF